MSDLTIGRLTASTEHWPDPERVPQMLQHLADSRLQDAVRSQVLPDGEWCVRRVDLDVVLDPERPTSALESEWADQIVIALRRSLVDGTNEVVRYDRREQAVDDLLTGLALAEHQRSWAWRQVGILEDGDPRPETAPRELALRVLERLPHGAAAAVHRLVDRVGAPAVHRLLGDAGWAAVAALAAQESGTTTPAPGATSATTARTPGAEVAEIEIEQRAAALVAASGLARALRGSSLRVDDATATAWAVLVLARVEPSTLRQTTASALVHALARALRPASRPGFGDAPSSRRTPRRPGTDAVPAPSVDRHDAVTTGAAALRGEPAPVARPRQADPGPSDRAEPIEPSAADPTTSAPDEGERTSWGGLLFLLNAEPETGLPAALETPPLDARPLPWVLQQVAARLVPAAGDDPAVLALAGAEADPAHGMAAPDASESAALDRCAADWASATAARLRGETPPPDAPDDASLVRRMAARDAVVLREPGWVDIVLRLDEVDLDVRRCGLDIDPGWVWWLGQVVRFHYE